MVGVELEQCGLSGPIPAAELLQLDTLICLNLSENQLTGAIPVEIGRLHAVGSMLLDSLTATCCQALH